MALADMYKQNNVSYYESGQGMSGVFTDTIENLTANGMIDDSIFLNTGSTWSMKNTGTIGNHFAWYADWVSGVLAVRKGPDVVSITYLGSAILSKNTSCTVASLSAKQADGAGWANFKNARFMIDAIQATPGTASQYNAFNYAAYSGQKYGFNSCFIESIAGYATSNTAHNYTQINDYTTLTGDNAKRIVYSNYQVMLTNYNPYLADNATLGKYNIGYIWDFFNIGGEIVCVRDMLRMPNSAHWQSWAYYHDVTDKYVTIGGFGGNVVAGTQGALPESDDVKGIFSYNNSGTSANWFTTKNAVDYKTNSMGLRWCVGNNTISTAKQWRDNVRLGVMAASGIITHNQWIVGEAAIQASDNPNKNTDYDHIPAHGGGGGDDDDPWHGIDFGGTGAGSGGAFCSVYYMTGAELTSLKNWSNTSAPEGFDMLPSIIGLQQLPVAVSGAPTTVKFLKSGAITQHGESRVVDTGVSAGTGTGQPVSFSLGSVNINRRMQQRGEPYLDYDCTVELFLPFAGTFVLDTQAVMGRTISAQIVIDPVNGTAFAYAWVENNGEKMPIAYGSSPIAVDLPIASNQWGISRAAFKQASHQMTMNAIKDIGNFIIGLGTFKTG